MPKIADKNPRYRTKAELCRDLAYVLTSKLHYGTKHAVLSEATWVWTEFNGKYKGCEDWSEAAWRIKHQEKLLVHEHVIPKSIVIKRLFQLGEKATEASVDKLMATYCKGAIITKDEDARLNREGLRSKMPDGCNKDDIWARYASVEIVMRARP